MSRSFRYLGARVALSMLIVAAGFVCLSARAVSFDDDPVNVSNTRADAWNGTNQMAVVSPYVYVTWFDGGGPLFSRSTNSGQTFSAATEIFQGGGTAGPNIAAAGSNVYVARSARSKPKQPSQVYFKRSTNNGATFGAQVQVSNATGGGATFHAMAVSGNNVYLVWTETVGTQPDVVFARSNNSGGTFSAPVNLSNTVTGMSSGVKLAADGLGVHVTWAEANVGPPANHEIFYTGSANGGASFSSVLNVSNTNEVSSLPDVAVSGSNVYLAWREAQTQEIRFRSSTNGGASFSAPVDLSVGWLDSQGNAGAPQIAASGSDVHVIWHSNQDGDYDVYHVRSFNYGANFSTQANISNSTADSFGVLAANGANIYISWIDALAPTFRLGELFLAHSANSGASFADKVNVSTFPGDSRDPKLVATDTNIYVNWLDDTSGNWDVLVRRGTP